MSYVESWLVIFNFQEGQTPPDQAAFLSNSKIWKILSSRALKKSIWIISNCSPSKNGFAIFLWNNFHGQYEWYSHCWIQSEEKHLQDRLVKQKDPGPWVFGKSNNCPAGDYLLLFYGAGDKIIMFQRPMQVPILSYPAMKKTSG